MRNETSGLEYRYQYVTEGNIPKRADYETTVAWEDHVTYTWSETKYREVEVRNTEGEVTGTRTEAYEEPHSASETISRSKDYTLAASFEEALSGKVQPSLSKVDLPAPSDSGAMRFGVPYSASTSVTSANAHFSSIDEAAISRILKSAERTRAEERPFRENIQAVTSRVNSLGNDQYKVMLAKADQSGLTARRSQLQADREQLVKLKKQLDQYAIQDQSSVTQRWIDDRPEVFYDRNRKMQERVDHMIKRISYFDEQIARRQSSLELEYQTVNYDEKLAPVKGIKERNQKIIVGTGATVATTGAAAGLYYGVPEVRAKVDALAEEIGIYKKASKKIEADNQRDWMK